MIVPQKATLTLFKEVHDLRNSFAQIHSQDMKIRVVKHLSCVLLIDATDGYKIKFKQFIDPVLHVGRHDPLSAHSVKLQFPNIGANCGSNRKLIVAVLKAQCDLTKEKFEFFALFGLMNLEERKNLLQKNAKNSRGFVLYRILQAF